MNSRAKKWFPAILYGILILALSSIPGKQLPSTIHLVSDKILHVVLYTGAGLTVYYALPSVIKTVLIVSTYSALDENYQRLIPNRECDRYDWMADTIGGFFGALIFSCKIYGKRRCSQTAS